LLDVRLLHNAASLAVNRTVVKQRMTKDSQPFLSKRNKARLSWRECYTLLHVRNSYTYGTG
jgi:hypothetical protein